MATSIPAAYYRTSSAPEQSHTVRKCHVTARLLLDTSHTANGYEDMMRRKVKSTARTSCVHCDSRFMETYVGEQVCPECRQGR